MKKLSLSERIVRYLRSRGDWTPSGTIQRLAMEKGYTAQNAGRRLRECVEDGLLEVEYRKPRNHAYYRYIPKKRTVKEPVIEGNVVRFVEKTVTQ